MKIEINIPDETECLCVIPYGEKLDVREIHTTIYDIKDGKAVDLDCE